MLNVSRIIYRISAWLFFVGVVVQVFLAGLVLLAPGVSSWANHAGFGYFIGYVLLPLIVFAFVGRLTRAIKIQMGVLLLLYIVQLALIYLRTSVPIVSALHPVNAMLLFWFSLRHARQAGSITLSTVST
ncbi:MAG TPA: DUF6220 domain-containing protein [Anaerolineae bacterium]|nr:DUF6220 domain-containing protein [Anaerolineae bacterium]